ncbi:MAG: FKBP-type peptidyl-prolyl cis-trans isomerase [Bdellovibrionota bacterium]
MKTLLRLSLPVALAFTTLLLIGCNRAPSVGALKTDQQQQAYSIGFRYGQSLATQTPGLDIDTLAAAIAEGYKKQTPKLTDAEMESALQKLFVTKRDELVAANLKRQQDGTAFLQDALTKGFKATKTGVAYREVVPGKGAKPAMNSKVMLRYKALLPDGNVVDSTADKPDSAETFKVADLIPGLKEAVSMMPVGSRWNVLVPPEQGYGAAGTAKVPPNALVIYDLELVSVVK